MSYFETFRRKIYLKEMPLWMAILNVTPDSFSDGGRYDAVRHAMMLVRQGADILDVGGESTRPGASPVSVEEEMRRVIPVIREILSACHSEGILCPPISVDTRNPETAHAALEAGAEMLNDITGGENPEMRRLVAHSGAAFCFMHMQGEPRNMQISPRYDDVVEDIFAWLVHRRDLLLAENVRKEQLIADPGIGFGKTSEHNLDILRNVRRFKELDVTILIGHSRKRFLDAFGTGRLVATETVSCQMAEAKVGILRLHEKPHWTASEFFAEIDDCS